MKLASTITLLAAIAFAFEPTTAKADDEGAALVGGLIGGIIIGSILDDDRHKHHHVSYSYGRPHRGHHNSGYYKWVRVKIWVPGRYVYSCDEYGNRYRTWHRGHYTYNKRKVWVSYNNYRRGSRHYDDYCEYDRRDGRRYGHYHDKSRYARY